MERSQEKPRVSIFGNSVEHDGSACKDGVCGDAAQEAFRKRCHRCRKCCREDRHGGSGVGGAIFIFLGGMLLLNSFGLVPWSFWYTVAQFWPALLILLGVQMLLGRGILSRVIMFAVTVVVLWWVVLWGLARVQSPLLAHLPAASIISPSNLTQ